MLSVEEYVNSILERVEPLEPFPISLLESRGGVIAEDVTAPWPLPTFDSAAVDGYAVLLEDVKTAHPANAIQLVVSDILTAGIRPGKALTTGHAVRVSAGSPLPEETDAVIPIEFTDAGVVNVSIHQSAVFGQFIRRTAEDVAVGDVVVESGTQVDARILGLLAAIGRGSVVARPRPRVVVVSVGSELLDPGAPLEAGRIADSNGIMLSAAVAEAGGTAYRVGPIADDVATLHRVLEDQQVRADLIVVSGGSNAASYEIIRTVLNDLGEVEFSRIAMQPGSAHGFGFIGDEDIPVLVLPGNPVAAYVSFEVIIRPVLRHLQGYSQSVSALVSAHSANTFTSPAGRKHFVRAMREVSAGGTHIVRAIDDQGSHLVASLARTECLIVVPEVVVEVREGDLVDVLLLTDSAVW
ncbi:MAG: hypothetical protein RLZZ426_347 [Actinomycetota bacterium]|jgi:molybdopterin molybdotransferase